MRTPLIALGLALFAGPAISEVGVPREARCHIVVEAKTLMNGPCEFTPTDGQGSFSFKAYNGKYWGMMQIRDGIGELAWNGEPYASHAHDIERNLEREEGCWVTDRASFCFW